MGKTEAAPNDGTAFGKTTPIQGGGTYFSRTDSIRSDGKKPVLTKAKKIMIAAAAAVLAAAAILGGLTPIGKSGTTEDGFRYKVVGDHAVITGVEGNPVWIIPSEVRVFLRSYPVTEIGAGAFAGGKITTDVSLPASLVSIGANAFAHCEGLRVIHAYSAVKTAETSFEGCNSLQWVIVHGSENISGWNLPGGAGLYYVGMETALGKANGISREVKDGQGYLYATVDGEKDYDYVILSVSSGIRSIDEFPPYWIQNGFIWFQEGCLDGVGSISVNMPDNCAYDFSLHDLAGWNAAEGSFADMWKLTCDGAQAINAVRPAGAPRILPHIGLIRASMVRAEEVAELYDANERPDGRQWYTAIRDEGLSYSYSSGHVGHNYSTLSDMNSKIMSIIAENYGAAIPEEKSAQYAGQYYTQLGVAWAQSSDGKYAWASNFMIP